MRGRAPSAPQGLRTGPVPAHPQVSSVSPGRGQLPCGAGARGLGRPLPSERAGGVNASGAEPEAGHVLRPVCGSPAVTVYLSSLKGAETVSDVPVVSLTLPGWEVSPLSNGWIELKRPVCCSPGFGDTGPLCSQKYLSRSRAASGDPVQCGVDEAKLVCLPCSVAEGFRVIILNRMLSPRVVGRHYRTSPCIMHTFLPKVF